MNFFATRLKVVAFVVLGFATCLGFAQQPTPSPSVLPTPSPTPEQIQPVDQDAIRTVTEEIQLTVTALDSHGRFDPTLELADVLVFEDGVAQELRSARRVPAHVLLLLDTGGEINSAKRVRLTRASSLAEEQERSSKHTNNWNRDSVVPVRVFFRGSFAGCSLTKSFVAATLDE